MSVLPDWYLFTLVGLLGLTIGSFLNAVVYRVPAGVSLMGRSACPKCDHMIRAYDNVPVFSWLWLRAKCRDCRAPISWRYPAVEAGHCLAWIGLAAHFGWDPILPLLLFFMSVTFTLTLIDFDTMRLPDVIVFPTLAIVGVGLSVVAWRTSDWEALSRAGIGAAAFGVFFFAMWFLTGGRGLGFGDVKLSPALGALTAWFSLGSAAMGGFAAFVIGGVPGAILLATGILKRGTPVPFGPALLAGTWVGIIWGVPLTNAYLNLVGLT